jgi:chloramphenicol O-acetyltransferase type A|nr:hypothetical protein [Vector pPR3]
MEKKITGYTTVDISQWHRKEHFEAFQSVAQCTYNQTVQLDITAFLKTVKKNKHKFYPAFIHILARLMNAHPELGPQFPIPQASNKTKGSVERLGLSFYLLFVGERSPE